MLTYALGRGVERYDRCAVDDIVKRAGEGQLQVLAPGDRDREERSVPEADEANGEHEMKDLHDFAANRPARAWAAAIALPWLEAMMPRTLLVVRRRRAGGRRAAAHGVPLRAQRRRHGRLDAGRRGSADDAAGRRCNRWRRSRRTLLVLSGLTLDKARPNGDGPGDHARAMAAFLTGRQPRKTDGADIRVGVSVDQVAAQKVGKATRFASLEIGCEGGKNAGNCDSGYSCAYSANLSWRSESTPVAKEVNPRLVFERLFGDPGKGDDKARPPRALQAEHPRLRRRGRRQSQEPARRHRPAQARRVSDRRPRDRAAPGPRRADGRASRARRRPPGRPAFPRITASICG